MDYGRLGNSGLVVSRIGLGTNNFGGRIDFDTTRAVIDRAITQGITLFDTADVYGGGKSEDFIGQCLGSRRHDIVIATKLASPMGEGPYRRGTSRRYITSAVEDSLRRLRTDYIDLYQVHRPDPETPILETLQVLDDLVRQGKVRYVGHSNFVGWQIADAQWTARTEHITRPISAQHEYSLMDRTIEAEILPATKAMGLGLLPYFPLASGFLTGKYRRGQMPPGARLTDAPTQRQNQILNDANFDRLDRWEDFATQRGHSLIELAFGWLLAEPAVSSVIAGATTPEQVDSNVAAGNWNMSLEDRASVPL